MKLPDVAPPGENAKKADAPYKTPKHAANYVSLAPVAMPKEKHSFKGLWITLLVVLGLALTAYLGFSLYFLSHFTFNTTINGVNVAFKSADDVEEHLKAEIVNYTLQIKARESQDVTVQAQQIGLRYIADGQMDALLAKQQAWAWPLSLMPDRAPHFEHASVEFDKQKLNAMLDALSFMDKEHMRAPVDVHLAFEGNQYVVAGGDEGTTLDTTKTKKAIAEAIAAGKTEIDLNEEELYARPKIAADNAALLRDRDLFNQYVPFQITYTLGNRTEVLDGYTTINWVDTKGEGPYTLDSAAVGAWVAEFASRYDTVGSTRTIINGYGEEKEVTGGTYGWQIDQEAEYWAIMNAAERHVGEHREPHLLGVAASLAPPDWGTTYLEVDLTQQHMWYYLDGQVVLETDVVTGNPNTGYATPEGVYSIFSKSTDVITRGDLLPDGSYEWEVPVTYWMPFTYSGCGFHDAGWQPSFGGDIYTWRGSHGCINMPPHLAAELYDMLEVGTPVITHH